MRWPLNHRTQRGIGIACHRAGFWVEIVLALGVTSALAAALLPWTSFLAQRQREALRAIRQAGGFAVYNWEWKDEGRSPGRKTWAPGWLVRSLGRDAFASIAYVDLTDCASDELLVAVEKLDGIEELVLTGGKTTDAGLTRLRRLSRLRYLDLSNTETGDVGVSYLSGLTNLQRLNLSRTRITDRGVQYLTKLTRLEELYLDYDDVGDPGLVHLAGLVRLRSIGLGFSYVSDAGLALLNGLSRLEKLDLIGTRVKEFGAQEARRRIPRFRCFLQPRRCCKRKRRMILLQAVRGADPGSDASDLLEPRVLVRLQTE